MAAPVQSSSLSKEPRPVVDAGVASEPVARVGASRPSKMVVAATCKAERSSGFNSQLSLFELGSGTLGVCGMTMDAAATFFISREGHARAAPEVFAELPAIKRYGLPVALMDAEGADLDSLDISIANLMTRADMTQRFRRRRGADALGGRGSEHDDAEDLVTFDAPRRAPQERGVGDERDGDSALRRQLRHLGLKDDFGGPTSTLDAQEHGRGEDQ